MRKVVQGALGNADVPFQQVVSGADIPRSSAYTPLFQTMFTMEEGVAESPDVMAAARAETMEVRRWRSLQSHVAGACLRGVAEGWCWRGVASRWL